MKRFLPCCSKLPCTPPLELPVLQSPGCPCNSRDTAGGTPAMPASSQSSTLTYMTADATIIIWCHWLQNQPCHTTVRWKPQGESKGWSLTSYKSHLPKTGLCQPRNWTISAELEQIWLRLHILQVCILSKSHLEKCTLDKLGLKTYIFFPCISTGEKKTNQKTTPTSEIERELPFGKQQLIF